MNRVHNTILMSRLNKIREQNLKQFKKTQTYLESNGMNLQNLPQVQSAPVVNQRAHRV